MFKKNKQKGFGTLINPKGEKIVGEWSGDTLI